MYNKRERVIRMKKCIALCLLLVLTISLCLPARADELQLDLNALTAYVQSWDAWFKQNGFPFTFETDFDIDDAQYFCLIYNSEEDDDPDSRFNNDLFIAYDLSDSSIAVLLQGPDIDAPLKSLRIYTEDQVLQAGYISDQWDKEHDWFFNLDFEAWIEMVGASDVTMRFEKENGFRYFTLFAAQDTQNSNDTVDLIAYLMIDAMRYASPILDTYLSAELLPSGAGDEESLLNAVSQPLPFSSDYNAIEAAAQSMFLVEVYDIDDDCIATGSGFVAFDEHYFITNQHVIEDAAYLVVYDDKSDEKGYKLTNLLAVDEEKDIAILAFDAGQNYDPLPLAPSSDLMRGQPVVVIGSPKGVKNTVSAGNISALVTENGARHIQFTAAVSPGSSGGAIFNDSGKVIGLVYAKLKDSENMNYAIDIAEVVRLKGSITAKSTSLKDYNRLAIATATPKPTKKPTPKPTATPKPAPAQYLIIPNGGYGEWQQLGDNQINMRIEIENISSKTVKSYTLCYSANDPQQNFLNRLLVSTKTIQQTIAPGSRKYSGYFPFTLSSTNTIHVGIKQVELSDGTVITYDIDDIDFYYWTFD